MRRRFAASRVWGGWGSGVGAHVIPRERSERRDLLYTYGGRLRCRVSRSRRFARDDGLSFTVIPHERSECRDLPATCSGRLRRTVSRSRRFARDDGLSFTVIPHERSECRDLPATCSGRLRRTVSRSRRFARDDSLSLSCHPARAQRVSGSTCNWKWPASVQGEQIPTLRAGRQSLRPLPPPGNEKRRPLAGVSRCLTYLTDTERTWARAPAAPAPSV